MRQNKKGQAKSSLAISIAVHAVILGGIGYFAAKTGLIPDQVSKFIGILPEKKEKPPEPPKPPPETAQENPNPPPPPPNNQPRPVPQNLTARAADPNARAIGGASSFAAEARPDNAPRAAVIQPRQAPEAPKPVPPAPAPRQSTPALTAAPSAFSAESTKPSTVAAVLEERKKSVAVQDSVSSEQISRSGTGDAAEVVTKITGASVVEGRHAVIRGLSDRYNATTLNGAEVPSADPYRRSVQMDVFSTDMIDRVVTTKTFTPDQPGSFTGGAINIVTKSFPPKRFFKMSVGTSYNTQSSLQSDFLSYNGGGLDWAAMDDGTRELPANLVNTIPTPPPADARRNETPEVAKQRLAAAEKLAGLTREMGVVQFAPVETKSPLNQSYSASFGDTTRLGGHPFGWLGGFNYGQNYTAYSDMENNRYGPALVPRRLMRESRGVHEAGWGANFTLAWQPHPWHEFSFNFLHSQNAEDLARRRVGDNSFQTGNDPATILDQSFLSYTERMLRTFQVKGRHSLPLFLDQQIDWTASIADTSQNEPDLRFFNYYRTPDGRGGETIVFDNSLPQPMRPTRFFRDLKENNLNLKLDDVIPFSTGRGSEGAFKVGGFLSKSERQFSEQTFSYRGDTGFLKNAGPNDYLNEAYFGYRSVVGRNGTNYIFDRYITSEVGNNRHSGEQTVTAVYGMIDVPIFSKLRMNGGGRLESTDLGLTSNRGGFALKKDNFLPALSLVWQVSTNANLRAGYGKTLARPTFREVAPYDAYDTTTDEILRGNTNLVMSSIKNYDLRWEWFPNPGEVISIGAFYKDLQKPIEKFLETLDGDIITYANRDSAKLYGIEVELRKNLGFIDPLLTEFTLGASVAIIQSEVALTEIELKNKRQVDPGTSKTRPLYDQSPLLVNLDLAWDHPRTGTSATLLANITTERIFIATGVGPDIYEQPGPQLDFMVTQMLGRRWRLRLGARNLLNPTLDRTYGKSRDYLFSSQNRGRAYSISLSATF